MDPQPLAKRITQDWIRMRETLARPSQLKDDLRMDPFLIQRLEEGLTNFPDITEFLQNSVSYVYQAMARSARSVPSLLDLSNIESVVRILLLCLGIEMGLTTGQLKPSPSVVLDSQKDYSINQMMSHIHKLQANFPELARHKQLLTVLELYDQYLQMQEEFRRESPLIEDSKAPAFYTSFKLKIDKLSQEIKQHYQELMQQLTPDQFAESEHTSLLVNEALTRVVLSLAQEVCKIYSLVNLALEEGGHFREEFLKHTEKKIVVLALINEQANILRSLLPAGSDLARYVGRQVKEHVRQI